jgi:putative endonuclease
MGGIFPMASVPCCAPSAFRLWCTSVHSHLAVGNKGELVAAKHLRGLGYTILDRNVRIQRGEIDIIAKKADEVVFIEVKARTKKDGFQPSHRVDWRKLRRLKDAADAWLKGREDVFVRIDVIGVCDGKVVEHYEDVSN